MIETVNLTKKFGDLTAVDGVTLRVEGERSSDSWDPMERERPLRSGCFAV